jgi:hypothetical protein
MPRTNNHKESDKKIRASVKKEMAEPRIAKSARIPEQPSITMPGTVVKIIPPCAGHPEKAQITADGNHRYLRIVNALTDKNGVNVKLKKGNHVQVRVTAGSKKFNRCDCF